MVIFAWVIVPVMSLFTSPPEGDDVTKLLDGTRLNPLIVAFTALIIIAFLVFFIFKNRLLWKIKDIHCELLLANRTKHSKAFWVRLIIGIVFGAIIVILGCSTLMPKPILEKSLSIEVNSSTKDLKLPLKVQVSKLYNMEMKLEAKGIITDIQIYSENGTLVYQNICEWFTLGTSLNLQKGNYVIVLTFLKDPISMQEYFKAKGYKFKTYELEQLKKVFSMPVKNHPVSFSVTIK